MSPKTRSSLLNITAIIGAVVAVAGLTGGAVRLADRHYVLADTFTVYQQGESKNRAVDSIIHVYERLEMKALRADLDTVKRMLRTRR